MVCDFQPWLWHPLRWGNALEPFRCYPTETDNILNPAFSIQCLNLSVFVVRVVIFLMAFETIRLLQRQGSDALPANHNVQASEHQGWQERKNKGCPVASSTAQFEMNCLSHQCALSKKPSLLAISGLCSSLVRFTRSMRSSKFQDLFAQGLDTIAQSVDRRVVANLPQSCISWSKKQKIICQLMGHNLDFNEDHIDNITSMFNSDWSQSFQDEGSWVHWCAGCCADRSETIAKSREILRLLFQRHPDVPLLYRWKGWEEAQDYTGLGIIIHGFLQFLVTKCCNSNSVANVDKAVEMPDEDLADCSFAVKQEIRMTKTLAFLTGDSVLAPRPV